MIATARPVATSRPRPARSISAIVSSRGAAATAAAGMLADDAGARAGASGATPMLDARDATPTDDDANADDEPDDPDDPNADDDVVAEPLAVTNGSSAATTSSADAGRFAGSFSSKRTSSRSTP